MSYSDFEKYKTSQYEKYICPLCSSRNIKKFFNDVYDMDVRYECQKCKFINDNELMFKRNSFTAAFDDLSRMTKRELKKLLPKLEKQYIKERKRSESMWETYGSELAGDFASEEYILNIKIKIIKNLIGDGEQTL